MGDMINLTGMWQPYGESRYIARGRAQVPDGKFLKEEDILRLSEMLMKGSAVFYLFRNDQKGNPKAPAYRLVVGEHHEKNTKPPDDDMPF